MTGGAVGMIVFDLLVGVSHAVGALLLGKAKPHGKESFRGNKPVVELDHFFGMLALIGGGQAGGIALILS